MADADDVLRESLRRAHRLLDDAAPAELLRVLKRADADLKRRLVGVVAGSPGLRFSEAQALAYQAQVQVVTAYVRDRLLGITHDAAERAVLASAPHTARDIASLDRIFTGIAKPLRIREAAVMEGIVRRAKDALLNQHATSVDRYGDGMIRDFRRLMSRGLAEGVSQGQMVDALVGHGGPRGPRVSTKATTDPVTGRVIRLREEDIPEGLFVRKRYWAERVVRTEVAHAQNEARLRTIERSRAEDFPDMGKKILAVLDNRTALDSLAVHGQVRALEDMFQDGAGRQYLRPPARPNDRETIVPWRLAWDETPYSAPVPPDELAKLQAQEVEKQAPGRLRAQRVAQARKRYEAQAQTDAAAAMGRVHDLVGKQLADRIQAASVANDIAAKQTAQVEAKAKARVAKERAMQKLAQATKVARERAQAAATALAKRKAVKTAAAKIRAATVRARASVEKTRGKP